MRGPEGRPLQICLQRPALRFSALPRLCPDLREVMSIGERYLTSDYPRAEQCLVAAGSPASRVAAPGVAAQGPPAGRSAAETMAARVMAARMARMAKRRFLMVNSLRRICCLRAVPLCAGPASGRCGLGQR